MDDRTREQYLEAQILTATPERLHLLLISGAKRFSLQLRAALESNSMDAAGNASSRLRDVLTEMLTSVARDDSEVTKRMRSLYLYLIRELGEAMLHTSTARVDNILAILDIEQETWQQVCQNASATAETPASIADYTPSHSGVGHSGMPASAAAFNPLLTADLPNEPFSLQA